jgi:RNA polymerase II subunit A C-terminal domain phosphatase
LWLVFNFGRIDDFFVGIGDINSSFLPKIESAIPAQPSPGKDSEINHEDSSRNPAIHANSAIIDTPTDILPTTSEAEIAEQENKAMLTRNNAALDAQLEERPLAKKQEELQDHDNASTSACVKEPSPKPGNLPKKPLLKNDDHELERLGKVGYSHGILSYCFRAKLVQLLDEVHSRFFSAHAARLPENTRRKTALSPKTYDVTVGPVLNIEWSCACSDLFKSIEHHSSATFGSF